MIITKNQLRVLSNFAKINPSLYYDGSKTLSIRSIDKILRAECKINNFIDVPFSFYDINVILPFMKDGNELNITATHIIIKTDLSILKYRLSSNERIAKEAGNQISFDTFNLDKEEIKYNIRYTDLKEFLDSCKKLNCDTIEIYSRNDKTFVMKGFIRNAKATATYETNIECEHEHTTNVFVFDITKLVFVEGTDITFTIGMKTNKNGNIIPVMKAKVFLDDLEVKYILVAQTYREKEATDE